MSGPKVVRIITREEIMAICEGHLARLDAVIAEWIRIGKRNDIISGEDIAAAMERRDAIQRLLTLDRFRDVQRQVPEEITYLRADLDERLNRAITVAAEARSACRRLSGTAATLLGALERAGKEIPEDLRRTLVGAQVVKEGQERVVESALSRAFTLLGRLDGPQTATDRQRQLAQDHGADTDTMTIADWVATQPQPPADEVTLKIDRYIAELQTLEGVEAAAPFVARAASVAREASQGQRHLLLDSLALDLAAVAKVRRIKDETMSKLVEMRAEIRRFNTGQANHLAQTIEKTIANRDVESGRALLTQAGTFLEEETRRFAAVARREAVLKGLATLGYEVREGMATAWAHNGKILLRKAAAPEYGIEVGGSEQGERLQFRVVGFGEPNAVRDKNRDRDMETVWCAEVERMQALIAKVGGSFAIERAAPAGAVPIKVIEDAGIGRDTGAIVGEPRARKLT